ncbi:MAG TPA: LemA family protein [Candidatus Aminicenantes bacterium]|nr:LemA family protein [Candidatus Aminicenantes bacterium]
MNKKLKIGCLAVLGILVVVAIGLYSWGKNSYNQMVTLDEGVKEKWSQVENVYQRRFDLIPNLVETVKGYAKQEKDTFTAVTEARAKAGGTFNISEEVLNNPEMFQKFQQAQSSLGNALQRLLVIQERYPELKSNENFLQLQSQLEGTENRIAVERRRFNEAAREYNVYIRIFPRSFLANLFGFDSRPYFAAAEGADQVPKVQF